MLISLENATDLLLEALLADAERESEIYAQLAAMPEATRQALLKNTQTLGGMAGAEKTL